MSRDKKPHIGIFGRRNNGKSSLINRLTGQDTAIVSDIAGTTTDPVKKSIEIIDLGPVIVIDTAGFDDSGELGKKRVARTRNIIKDIDLAILVITNNTLDKEEEEFINQFKEHDTPFIIIHNKADIVSLSPELKKKISMELNTEALDFSAVNQDNISPITNLIKQKMPSSAYQKKSLLGDILRYGDLVLLVTPIDAEAPEGRLILPQVQAIRDILENDCIAVVAKERELDSLISRLQPTPALVITDSQVFPKVDASIPPEIPLTSFSIMLAHFKGNFEYYLKGTPMISKLKDGDSVLMLESCTHQVSCDDIGRVKLPRWISNFTGKKLHFDIVNGLSSLSKPITSYSLVVQCGGCMITEKQLKNRLNDAIKENIPVTNYGMAIAYVHGIYNRAIQPFAPSGELGQDYL